jgi:hypothetical protein
MQDQSKRPATTLSTVLQPEMFVPETQQLLTADYYFLSDRQKLSWAYQTETQIRFEKLVGSNKSTTLQSKYLHDVYPMTSRREDLEKFQNLRERDRAAFRRKAVPYLRASQCHDGSLTLIDIRNYDRLENHLLHHAEQNFLPVPPNFLFFEILLEAFLGYNLKGLYNSQDPTMPRAAIMGGAVVAALCSWNELDCKNLWDQLEQSLVSTADPEETYVETKQLLTKTLHKFFLARYEDDLPTDQKERQVSIFHSGDVDVFLQPSPLTRALYHKLTEEYELTQHVMDLVVSFCGGIGLCHNDLQIYAKRLLDRLEPKYQKWATFIYSLAKNGLSFILAPNDDPEYEYWDAEREAIPWPRTTQLIMLDPRADLLGALLDFDLSASTCAFDGVTVRVAPRAAYSLVTRTCVSTPFTVEEMRNRKRIVKYFKRGFNCAVLDPCCRHQPPCNNFTTAIEKFCDVQKGGIFGGRALRGEEHIEEVAEIQENYWDEESLGPVGFCCSNEKNDLYSLAMFEKSEGDATRFLAGLNEWSKEELESVLQTPNELRACCKQCWSMYSMSLFFTEESPLDGSVEDVLHGDKAFKFSNGHTGFLYPSFYSGGAFDPTLVRSSARNTHKAKGILNAQSLAERVRYVMKHGSQTGYVDRFTHGDDFAKVFLSASKIVLPGSNRAPVGLNPERFIASCESCHAWLHGCEYGTQFCTKCSASKVASKKPREE